MTTRKRGHVLDDRQSKLLFHYIKVKGVKIIMGIKKNSPLSIAGKDYDLSC